MIYVHHTNIYKIHDYSQHLKHLAEEDKVGRFGYKVSDHSIDQMILSMCYNPSEHELWYARTETQRVGWGHLAKNHDGSWELAVSVQKDFQRQGIGNQLITEMLAFAKFHHITEVYMHCITDNKVIQHLARKNDLVVKYRGGGEIDSAIELPAPTVIEYGNMLYKEQVETAAKIGGILKNHLSSVYKNRRAT